MYIIRLYQRDGYTDRCIETRAFSDAASRSRWLIDQGFSFATRRDTLTDGRYIAVLSLEK